MSASLPPPRLPELVCPAGGLPALKAAVDHGADCVYVGFRDTTNARAFAGLDRHRTIECVLEATANHRIVGLFEFDRDHAFASADRERRSEQAGTLDGGIALVDVGEHVGHDVGEQPASDLDRGGIVDVRPRGVPSAHETFERIVQQAAALTR